MCGLLAASPAALASCLTFNAPDLQALDLQTEGDANQAIRNAKSRVSAAIVPSDALLRAQLFAVLADAYTEQSQHDQAKSAIAMARAQLKPLASSPDVDRLRLRLDLLEDQWLIANGDSAAAVKATSTLLDGQRRNSLERACTLSVRAVAFDYLYQPDRAVADALETYRLAQQGNWANARLEAAVTLARKFGGAGLFPQAERMMIEAIALATVGDRRSLLATLDYELGILLVDERRFTDARTSLEQSNVYARQLGDRFSEAATNATLCWALLNEGDLGTAERVCNTGDADLARGHRADLSTLLIGYRARLDLEHHRPAAALIKLDAILTPEIHALLPRFEAVFFAQRARAFAELRRYREAAVDFARMHDLEEAADNAQRNRQVAVLSALVASESLTAANLELQERVAKQQRGATHQREQRITFIAVAVIICSLLGILLWISHRHGRALRHQEIILRSAGHNSPDAFLLFDGQRCVRFANRNMCGHGSQPVIGQQVGASLPSTLQPALNAAIDKAFESHTIINFGATLVDDKGSPRLMEFCVVPALEHASVVGGTVRAIDVTEQRELEREVVDGASNERQRLSSELHEGLGQQLAGVLLLLVNASKVVRRDLPAAARLIDEIAGYAREAIEATRDLARSLAPVKIGMGSLTIALQRLVADAARRLSIEIACDCRLDGVALSNLAADHIYGICREAVTNAASHGRAKRIAIVVQVDNEVLTISVDDDGTGMPNVSHDSQSLGFKMMAYRTRLLGGECRFSELPGGGTGVFAVVPRGKVIESPRPGLSATQSS